MPFGGPGFDRHHGVTLQGAGDTVVVAITHAVVSRKNGARSAFSRHLWRVVDSLPEHEGFIGYSVRRELFGRDAWTLSAWIDEAAMERFVESPVHRQAVEAGTLESARFARIELATDELPLGWQRALSILEQQNRRKAAR